MNGLGPHGTSLLDRCGHPPHVWDNPFAMQLEQINRQEQRKAKAIWHAMRHKKPTKPLAPVGDSVKFKGEERRWTWEGEDIPSKGLIKGLRYTATVIRAAGFKLPPIGGKKSGRTQSIQNSV